MASTTVRLYPLVAEHTLPLLMDLAFFIVAYGAWLAVFGNHATAAVLALAVLFHVVQVTWFLQVRFDDDGITIIRLWRRRHVEWSQIAGLIYTNVRIDTRSPYKLRLVLAGHEPPFGRYLSPAEMRQYGTGPVVMMLTGIAYELHTTPDSRSVRCAERIYAELERHGFPKPPPAVLEYRSPKHTVEEARRAVAEDFLRRRDQK